MATDPPPAPAGGIPPGVHVAQDYEALSGQRLPAATAAYIAGGSGRDLTLRANLTAFASWAVCPRVLVDVSAAHTRLRLGGEDLPHPILLAPVAFQKLVHPAGEAATALAAKATESCMVCSTLSSCSLEDIARASTARKWFQLYLQPRREASLALVRRAEAAGYGAIVLTLDATVQVPSQRALRAGFRMPADCVAVNLQAQPSPAMRPSPPGASRVFQGLFRDAPQVADLDWLMAQTDLPVWIKGVLHPADAQALRAHGVAGIVVSNHGGRGLDGAPASLRALPKVRAAVGPDFPLLFDGGVRSGIDVFKAIALGADAVMIGRLQLHALSVAGALGVAHLIKLLREELELCMAQAGCATLAHIRQAALWRAEPGPHDDAWHEGTDADHD